MVGQPPGIQTNPSSRLRIEVVAFTRDGSVASTYGASGHGYIELPSPANGVQVMVTGSGNSVAIVCSTANGSGLELVEINDHG